MRLVCAAHAQVESLPHVTHKIDALLFQDRATQWTLESASERGLVRLMDRLLKDEWRGLNGRFRLLRLNYAIKSAIENGYAVSVIKWWLSFYMPGQTKFSVNVLCRLAIKHGNLQILQWLFKNKRDQLQIQSFSSCKSQEIVYWLYKHDRQRPVVVCVDAAASVEHIQWCMTVEDDQESAFTIRWPSIMAAIELSSIEMFSRLHRSRPQPNALEIALRFGRLDVAKRVYQNFPHCRLLGTMCQDCQSIDSSCDNWKWKCTDLEITRWIFSESGWKDLEAQTRNVKKMMEAAVGKGNTDVLRFLFDFHKKCSQNMTESLSNLSLLDSSCFDSAAANGHLSVMQVLHDEHQPCTTKAMDQAAASGRLNIVQWLHVNRSEGCTVDAMNNAASKGHLDVVRWLHDHRTEGCTADAMDGAATCGRLDVVKWLHENRREGCTSKAMDHAAKYGHLNVVQWLYENRTEGCTAAAMDGAASYGHLEIIQWLHNNNLTTGCTTRVMNTAAKSGHFEVVQWLHLNRTEGCTTEAMDLAAEFGHLNVVQFLHQNRLEGCSSRAQLRASQTGRVDVFKWFHENKSDTCPPFIIQDNAAWLTRQPDIVEFAAHHEGYVSHKFAADTLIRCNRYATAERILREAAAKETS